MIIDLKKMLNVSLSEKEILFLVSIPFISSIAAAFVVIAAVGVDLRQFIVIIFTVIILGMGLGAGLVYLVESQAKKMSKQINAYIKGTSTDRTGYSVIDLASDAAFLEVKAVKKAKEELLTGVQLSMGEMTTRIGEITSANEVLLSDMTGAKKEVQDNAENIKKVSTIINNVTMALNAMID
jgi:hypothetical protein